MLPMFCLSSTFSLHNVKFCKHIRGYIESINKYIVHSSANALLIIELTLHGLTCFVWPAISQVFNALVLKQKTFFHRLYVYEC